jgi:4'-phosphopantetheinyl transferase EntD
MQVSTNSCAEPNILTILPKGAAGAEIRADTAELSLLPEEEGLLGRATEGRHREFMAGRTCARRALEDLGLPVTPVLRGAHRQPLWPAGIVGSITHCDNYCAAAVAYRTRLVAIGIDAEIHDALPSGILDMVAVKEERMWLRSHSEDTTHWDRVLFSAKESVYKAWFSITGSWLGFEDALVSIQPETRTLHADLLVSSAFVDGRPVTEFEGHYIVLNGLVLTTVSLDVK